MWLSPDEYTPMNATRPRSAWFVDYVDITFVHEAVHALRMMDGLMWRIPVVDPARVRREPWVDFHTPNNEEYLAVMIANMYCSERRLPGRQEYSSRARDGGRLRRQRFIPNAMGMEHPRVQIERIWVGRVFLEQQAFAHDLANIPRSICPYNPFDDWRRGTYSRIPDY